MLNRLEISGFGFRDDNNRNNRIEVEGAIDMRKFPVPGTGGLKNKLTGNPCGIDDKFEKGSFVGKISFQYSCYLIFLAAVDKTFGYQGRSLIKTLLPGIKPGLFLGNMVY